MPEHLGRNFVLGVISGVAYNLYVAVLSTELVMTWFLSELTRSNLLISLLVPIELGSWYFLQLLLSGYVQRRPLALPLYRLTAVVRLVALAVVSFAAFWVDERSTLLIVFLAAFTINSLAAGVAALPFLNVVAKTIPPTRRGMYFGWRRFAGGLLGLGGGLVVKVVLSQESGLSFPDNYGLLFSLGFVLTVILVGSFSLIIEPEEAVDRSHSGLADQLRRALIISAHDRNFRRFLGLRAAIVASNFALPFYAVYARRELGAPEDQVGIYLIGLTLASVLSNLVLGQVGDRRGNCLLMRLVALSATLPPALALLLAHLPEIKPQMGLDKSLIFTLVFVLQGVHTTASAIGGINYVLELSPSAQRVLYVGFANGVVGLTLFFSPLGGAIVDWVGFEPLFLLALMFSLVGVILSLGLEEPRRKAGTANW